MTDDLISRSALIEALKIHFDDFYRDDGRMMYSDHIITAEDCDDLIKFVKEQPTAYDMDKVVKEIQTYEASEFVRRCYDENLIYKDAAVDIVKRGGIGDVKTKS
jgi:hypothetical protein